jgi:hypothetical protein
MIEHRCKAEAVAWRIHLRDLLPIDVPFVPRTYGYLMHLGIEVTRFTGSAGQELLLLL